MLVQKGQCPECGGGQFVTDMETGEIVCSRCGLVLQDEILDQKPEWRAFTPEETKPARSRAVVADSSSKTKSSTRSPSGVPSHPKKPGQKPEQVPPAWTPQNDEAAQMEHPRPRPLFRRTQPLPSHERDHTPLRQTTYTRERRGERGPHLPEGPRRGTDPWTLHKEHRRSRPIRGLSFDADTTKPQRDRKSEHTSAKRNLKVLPTTPIRTRYQDAVWWTD